MKNIKDKRQSKNIEDIRSPKEAAKHTTKARMGIRHAARTLGTSNMGNRITTHNNIVGATEPFSARIPRLMKDKPKTIPKDTKPFEKGAKDPKVVYKFKTKRVNKGS